MGDIEARADSREQWPDADQLRSQREPDEEEPGEQGEPRRLHPSIVIESRIRSTLLYYGFFLALAALVVAFADPLLGSGRSVGLVRLVDGSVLAVVGSALLLQRTRDSRRALAERLAGSASRGRLYRWLVGQTLFVLGLAFVAVGVLELVRGLQSVI